MRFTILAGGTAALLLAGGCMDKNPYENQGNTKVTAGPAPKIVGVHPDTFDCQKFLSPGEVGGVVGTEVTWAPADMKGTPGTPDPCIYIANVQPGPPDAAPRAKPADAGPSKGILAWQFHLDCRPVAVGDAQSIMAGLKGQSDTREVQLGRGAVDHTNARVIAVDDDTDCAAYVVGPDVTTRTALAQLVITRLDPTTMPKSPRAQR